MKGMYVAAHEQLRAHAQYLIPFDMTLSWRRAHDVVHALPWIPAAIAWSASWPRTNLRMLRVLTCHGMTHMAQAKGVLVNTPEAQKVPGNLDPETQVAAAFKAQLLCDGALLPPPVLGCRIRCRHVGLDTLRLAHRRDCMAVRWRCNSKSDTPHQMPRQSSFWAMATPRATAVPPAHNDHHSASAARATAAAPGVVE